MSDVVSDVMSEAEEVFGQADDIFMFRKLLGKSITRIIYWAGAAVYTIGALVLLV